MLFGIILFFLGLAIGSFLNSFLYRYETHQKFTGRSFCPNCKNQIAWYDNLPLLSYLILRGKCRHCKKPISWQYPTVELITAVLFVLIGLFTNQGRIINAWLNVTPTPSLVIPTAVEGSLKGFLGFARNDILLILNILIFITILLIASCLLLIAIHDAKTKEIPNGFNLLFILSSIVYSTLSLGPGSSVQGPGFLSSFLPYFLAGAVAFLFFYSLVYFSKETWMGGGDAKLALGMGILLGPANTFLAILIASWTGAAYGVGKLITQNKKQLTKTKGLSQLSNVNRQLLAKHQVPFGPFLVLGTLISFLFGSQIVDWYVKIVLGL